MIFKFEKKIFLPILVGGIISLIASVLTIFYINPNEPLKIGGIYLNPAILLFLFGIITIFAFGTLILKSFRRGILVGILVLSIFFLQYLHLNNLLYTLILIALTILSDIFFKKSD